MLLESLMLPWVKNKSRKRIAVIGDIILDEYLEGEVERISPEAPVPVHLIKKQYYRAGGAANAAKNVQLLGGQTYLFSVCGNDEAGKILSQMLASDEINLSGVSQDSSRPTIKKTRITSGHQQMLRVDWEKAQPIDEDLQKTIISKLISKPFDGILVSDYGKGALPEQLLANVFKFAKENKIKSIVDPKGKDFNRYLGCDLITPNRKEACHALGIDMDEAPDGESLGRMIQRKFGLNDVLVTLGAQGMVFVPKNESQKSFYFTPQNREVYDVSGAGDTVAALMTLCLTCDLKMEQAVEISTVGAGVVVEKWGTRPLYCHELEDALANHYLRNQSLKSPKILMSDELNDEVFFLRQKGKKIVFTNGCFDLLHAGHLSYLEKAKTLGDVLIVGINSDHSVKNLKGDKRPIVPLDYRMKLLSGLQCVDYVISFDEHNPLNLIEKIKPDFLVKGADYKKEDIVGFACVKSYGGEVHTIDLVEGLSTSILLDKIHLDKPL